MSLIDVVRPKVRDTFPACNCAQCLEVLRGQVVQSFAYHATRDELDPKRVYEVVRDNVRTGFKLVAGVTICAFCGARVKPRQPDLMEHARTCRAGLTPKPTTPPKGAA